MKLIPTSVVAAVFAPLLLAGCGSGNQQPVPTHPNAVAALSAPPLTPAAERQLYLNGARTAWAYLAVLAAQEERFKRTGVITLVSEDALPDSPYYFYYYSLYRDGDSFVVDGPGPNSRVDGPQGRSTRGHPRHRLGRRGLRAHASSDR